VAELARHLGVPSVDEALRRLLRLGVGTVILTEGRQGTRAISAGLDLRSPAFEVEAVDTVGAGDAFSGGLACALAEGRELEEALRFANATAALSVTRRGAQASMPPRDEIEKLLA